MVYLAPVGILVEASQLEKARMHCLTATALARLERGVRFVVKTLKIGTACVLFGAAYGAVCGAVWGVPAGLTAWWNDAQITTAISVQWLVEFGVWWWTLVGCAVGVLGGALGRILGVRLGWCLAGVLGGLTYLGERLLRYPGDASLLLPDYGLDQMYLAFLFLNVAPILIGGALGLAVGCGLRRGKSSVPGVQALSRIINDTRPQEPAARAPAAPAEVAPAAAPQGRGHEATPAGSEP